MPQIPSDHWLFNQAADYAKPGDDSAGSVMTSEMMMTSAAGDRMGPTSMTAQILKFSKRSDTPAKATAKRRRTPRRHPLLGLPFIMDRRKGDRRRCFWHVSPTGDYTVDSETGARLAQQYLEFCDGMRPPLGWIVEDMPRELTGIEIGFLRLVGLAASPYIARQVRERDAREMAEFAARGEAADDPNRPRGAPGRHDDEDA